MARYTLSAEVNYDDLSVIGISCHQKIYRLCWAMNKKLGFTLVKTDDYIIDKESKQQVFTRYEFLQSKTEIRYSLIENRGIELSKKKLAIVKPTGKKNILLMPEMKNIDFLLVSQGVMPDSDMREFINELKNVTFILAVFTIPLDDYKSKSNFLNFL